MPVKLAVFDVDGTLVRGDTLCQTLARGLGRYERMCELETMSGQANIIAAREEMAGWYIEAGMAQVESALGDAKLAPGAEEGIAMLRDAGVSVAFASITWSFAVSHIAARLGVTDLLASGLDFASGEIDHVWGETKARFMAELAARDGLAPDMTAAVGDTSSDYDMLSAAGVGVFVGTGKPGIRGVLHMPDADIRHVAVTILSR